MANRVSEDDVKGVLLSDYGPKTDGTNPSLTPFIDMAHRMTEKIKRCMINKGFPWVEEDLVQIEKWLSAHYYACSDRTYAAKGTLSASGTMDGKTDMGLKATIYGQQVLDFDDSGCANALATKARAGMFWLGKNPRDQIDYEDRR